MPLINSLAWLIVKIFFSSSQTLQIDNVPKDKPLLVVVNHNNQFVDAAVIIQAIPRKLGFIIAESSMHKPIIGTMARWSGAVPVIRPQDRAKAGKGNIIEIDFKEKRIVGNGTVFQEEEMLKKGSKIDIKGVATFAVMEVVSNTEVVVEVDMDNQKGLEDEMELIMEKVMTGVNYGYKIHPKIDQGEVYAEVNARLADNGGIAIFPEGGSHDQASLLPLKPGVAIMALGAIKNGVKDVQILPVGLNYFKAQAFRSRVIVEVGQPFEVPNDIYATYEEGDRRKAYQDLMELVKDGMMHVTLNAPDYKTGQVIRIIRRLYQNGAEIGPTEYLALSRRFLNGYAQWKEDDMFKALCKDVKSYMKKLESLGLKDKMLESTLPSNSCWTFCSACCQIDLSLIVWFLLMAIALPGIILNLPLTLYVQRKSNKEVKKALQKSKVKVKGYDVAASQKVINTVIIMPIVYIIYSIGLLVGLFFLDLGDVVAGAVGDHLFWIIPLVFLILLPFYTVFTVLTAESAIKRVRLFPIRLYTMWQVYSRWMPWWLGGRNRFSPEEDVRVLRRQLVINTQTVIGRLTADDEEWQNDPIISSEEMKKRRIEQAKRLVESTTRRQGDKKLLQKLNDSELNAFMKDVAESKAENTTVSHPVDTTL